jgi:hypothetical protein
MDEELTTGPFAERVPAVDLFEASVPLPFRIRKTRAYLVALTTRTEYFHHRSGSSDAMAHWTW